MDWQQIVFGAALVAALLSVSLYYTWRQVGVLRGLRHKPDLPDAELRYVHRQAWRRLVGCGLMLMMGTLLAVILIAWEGRAQQIVFARATSDFTREELDFLNLWGGSWIAILLMLMLVVFLAAWDLWATRRYSVREHRKIQADRRAMIERQVARMRGQRNGYDGPV